MGNGFIQANASRIRRNYYPFRETLELRCFADLWHQTQMSLGIYILKFSQKEKNKHCMLMNLENELYTHCILMNLEKCYRWTCLQGRNREQRCGQIREGEGGMNWENSIDIYILPHVEQLVGSCYITQGGPAQCSVMT